MIAAILIILSITAFIGLVLGYASIKLKTDGDPIIDRIDKILPQTQCGQCGYPGCKPYAEAIANGDEINKCPPGGESTIKKLA
ncbi:MAG: RnfABCDGE type electron transport complex subunit B, partial [Methylophilaceae bacterium]